MKSQLDEVCVRLAALQAAPAKELVERVRGELADVRTEALGRIEEGEAAAAALRKSLDQVKEDQVKVRELAGHEEQLGQLRKQMDELLKKAPAGAEGPSDLTDRVERLAEEVHAELTALTEAQREMVRVTKDVPQQIGSRAGGVERQAESSDLTERVERLAGEVHHELTALAEAQRAMAKVSKEVPLQGGPRSGEVECQAKVDELERQIEREFASLAEKQSAIGRVEGRVDELAEKVASELAALAAHQDDLAKARPNFVAGGSEVDSQMEGKVEDLARQVAAEVELLNKHQKDLKKAFKALADGKKVKTKP